MTLFYVYKPCIYSCVLLIANYFTWYVFFFLCMRKENKSKSSWICPIFTQDTCKFHSWVRYIHVGYWPSMYYHIGALYRFWGKWNSPFHFQSTISNTFHFCLPSSHLSPPKPLSQAHNILVGSSIHIPLPLHGLSNGQTIWVEEKKDTKRIVYQF